MKPPQKPSTRRLDFLLTVLGGLFIYGWAGYLMGETFAGATAQPLPAWRDVSKFRTVEEVRHAGELLDEAMDAREVRATNYRLTGGGAGCLFYLIVSSIREVRRRRNAPRLEEEARLKEIAFQERVVAARQRTAALWRKDHPSAEAPGSVS